MTAGIEGALAQLEVLRKLALRGTDETAFAYVTVRTYLESTLQEAVGREFVLQQIESALAGVATARGDYEESKAFERLVVALELAKLELSK